MHTDLLVRSKQLLHFFSKSSTEFGCTRKRVQRSGACDKPVAVTSWNFQFWSSPLQSCCVSAWENAVPDPHLWDVQPSSIPLVLRARARDSAVHPLDSGRNPYFWHNWYRKCPPVNPTARLIARPRPISDRVNVQEGRINSPGPPACNQTTLPPPVVLAVHNTAKKKRRGGRKRQVSAQDEVRLKGATAQLRQMLRSCAWWLCRVTKEVKQQKVRSRAHLTRRRFAQNSAAFPSWPSPNRRMHMEKIDQIM